MPGGPLPSLSPSPPPPLSRLSSRAWRAKQHAEQHSTQGSIEGHGGAITKGGAGRPLPGGSFIRSLPLLGEQWAQSSIAIAIMVVLCLRWARRRRGNDGGERRPLSQDRAPSAGSSVRYAAKAARQLTTLGSRCMEAHTVSREARASLLLNLNLNSTRLPREQNVRMLLITTTICVPSPSSSSSSCYARAEPSHQKQWQVVSQERLPFPIARNVVEAGQTDRGPSGTFIEESLVSA